MDLTWIDIMSLFGSSSSESDERPRPRLPEDEPDGEGVGLYRVRWTSEPPRDEAGEVVPEELREM